MRPARSGSSSIRRHSETMADEDVTINVQAHSIGEEIYDRHVAGIGRVADAHVEAGSQIERMAGRFDGARAALSGLNLALLSTARGMRFFGVANDVVSKAIDGMVTVLTLARSALAIHTALTQASAAANWQLAAAKAAGEGLGAVVIAASIIAAVGALVAYQ